MKNIMSTNVYEPKGIVMIAGTCLESMQPEGYKMLVEQADEVYNLCLEDTHINMAITKLSAILAANQVNKLIFASVDRSPHCTQMHYIMHEIERTLPEHVPVEDYVVQDNTPILISRKAIELSKTLSQLNKII